MIVFQNTPGKVLGILIEDKHVEIFGSYNKTIGKVFMYQKLARIVPVFIHIFGALDD